MNELKKAINILALQNMKGKISDDYLSQACEVYKQKKDDFEDNYNYHVYVSKSLFDHLNGIEPDKEICKAIIPGQTKVVDGVMYIYTATPNAKTQYDWRVYNGNKNVGRQISDQNTIDAKQKYVNELFPKTLQDLQVVKNLGGSTGAVLVKDSKGNQYVMKRGKNTNNDHVKGEYLTNQIYNILNVRTPDYELYDDNGEAVLLSKFIPLASQVTTPKQREELSKNFIADVLLANWDVYQNDNCLVDSANRVYRVDNGGALNFRAQGKNKTWTGVSVFQDFDNLKKFNQAVVYNLTDNDYIRQIDDILKKRDDVINYLQSSGENKIANVLNERFDNLEIIKRNLQAKINLAKQNILSLPPRNLKSDADMYRSLSDQELDSIYQNAPGNHYAKKIFSTGQCGWEVLSEICKLRGFDARPRIVDEQTYWEESVKSKYQLFRGVGSGKQDAESFKYNDSCFYGNVGLYGEGIYAHVNDGIKNSEKTEKTHRNSDAYKAALGYANGDSSAILKMFLEPSAKVETYDNLKQELNQLLVFNNDEVDAKQKEIDQLQAQVDSIQDYINNASESIKNKVKQDMHWDDNVLVTSQLDIDNTDWGAVTASGEPDYPDWNTFVVGKMFDWVKKNGGTVSEKNNKETIIFTLPNSKEKFMLSRYQWDNNAIKRKNAFSKPYNYPLKRFQDWMMKNHYQIIQSVIDDKIKEIGDEINNKTQEKNKILKTISVETQKLNQLKTKNLKPDENLKSGLLKLAMQGYDEPIGIYAAIKGVDAFTIPHGNGGPNSFMVILNRSKLVIKQ